MQSTNMKKLLLLIHLEYLSYEREISLPHSLGPILHHLCSDEKGSLLMRTSSKLIALRLNILDLFHLVMEHVLYKTHRWIELENIPIVDLSMLSQLVIVGESIIAFFTSTRELDLPHGKVM